MAILLVDSNVRVTDLLARTLEGDGHTVLRAADADHARRQLAVGDVGLVFVDLDLDRGRAIEVVGVWRRAGGGPVVVMGGRADQDPAVARALTEADADRYLKKPFSLLDVGDMVRRLAPTRLPQAVPPARPTQPLRAEPVRSPRAPEAPLPAGPTGGGFGLASGVARLDSLQGRPPRRPTAPADPKLAGRGLRLLARLWATRASGAVVVELDGREQEVRFSDGGPTRGADWEALAAVMHGAPARFELGASPPGGDAHQLGARLLQVARGRADGRYVERHRFDAFTLGRWPDAADRLPLPGRLRLLLQRADGTTTLGAALAEAGGGDEASRDVEALARLGLLSAQAPVARRGAPAAAPVARGLQGPMGDEPATVERRVRGRGPDSQTGPTRADSARAPTTSPSRAGSRTSPDHTLTSLSSRGVGRGRAGLRSALRGRAGGGAPGGAPDPARLFKQLRGELERLREAAPPVVLGIPADSEPDLVAQAAARLRARYAGLALDGGRPDAVRGAATELLALVEQAHAGMAHRAPATPHDPLDTFEDRPTDMALTPVASEEERLLELGEQLMARGQWAQADRALTRARDLQLAHPGILSALGWARFHNDERPPDARLEEGRDLLRLAEQFGGSEDPRSQIRLGTVLLAAGEHDGAAVRAERAARLAPSDPEVHSLQRALAAACPPDSAA